MFRFFLLFSGVSLVFLLTGLMQTGTCLFLPEIAKNFETDNLSIKWIIFVPTFISATLLLPFSLLFDRFQDIKLFRLFLIIFTIGSSFCFYSKSINFFIIGRALQGLGTTVLVPGSYILIKRYSSITKKNTQKIFSIFMIITSLFLISNAVISGFICETWGWRWVFGFMMLIGILIFVLITPKYRSTHPNKNIDLKKLLLSLYIVAPSLSCVILIHFGLNIYNICIFVFSIFLLRYGLIVNLRNYDKALKQSNIIKIFTCLLVIFGIQSIISSSGIVTIAFREVLGLTPKTAGMIMLLSLLLGIFAPLLSNKISSLLNERSFLLIGCIILLFSQFLLSFFGYFSNLEMVVIGRFLFGTIATLLFTKCMWILLDALDSNSESFMSGIIQQTRYICGSFCLALSSSIAFKEGSYEKLLSPVNFSLSILTPFTICLFAVLYILFKRGLKDAFGQSRLDREDPEQLCE